MLKRIAVLGDDEALVSKLLEAAPAADVTLTPMQPGASVPHAAAAVLAAGEHAVAALDAALSVCAGQETLFGLLADSLDAREGIPLGSSRRVCEHATRFAEALGLGPDERLTLERGALLRDIGKILIPNEILLKASVLTYDDWILLQRHTTLGAELLEERNFCADVADIVRYHHECHDGDGYPEHRERDDIPYFARIMRILDVYCAMTSPRHYRESEATHEEALEHLKSERGKHFDPELVDTFLSDEIGQACVRQETDNPPT